MKHFKAVKEIMDIHSFLIEIILLKEMHAVALRGGKERPSPGAISFECRKNCYKLYNSNALTSQYNVLVGKY